MNRNDRLEPCGGIAEEMHGFVVVEINQMEGRHSAYHRMESLATYPWSIPSEDLRDVALPRMAYLLV